MAWSFRWVRMGLPLLALAGALPSPARADALDDFPPIRQLRELLHSSADRDSLRFLLALAYRDTGTLEGRSRALTLFREIRPRYYDDYRYHRELALTYLEGDRRDDARESMRKAVERAPDRIAARGDLAELLLRHALRTDESGDIDELLRVVDGTLQLRPEDRTALLYKSYALSLARILDPARGAEGSLAGRAATEMILQLDPEDRSALLLQGVQCLELGEPEEASSRFQHALERMPSEDRAAFLLPTWSAPDSILRAMAAAPPVLRDSLVAAYWEARDPTLLTPVNENLLEYWKRLVLADVFFGRPEEDLRGWQTPRGEVFVRYGPPEAMNLVKASFEGGEAMVQDDFTLRQRVHHEVAPMSFQFLYPTQNWLYTFAGQPVEFSFIDPTLHDRFIAASPGAIASLAESIPSVLTEGFHGTIVNCFFGSAGTRGEAPRTVQSLIIGLPAADGETDPWADARLDLRVLDGAGQAVTQEASLLPPGSLRALPGGGALAIIARDVSLSPGSYLAEVRLRAGERAGTFSHPFLVRSFGRDSLQISDLRLAFPGESPAPSGNRPSERIPNPAGVVLEGAPVDVGFEVYNLVPESPDLARYEVRYTVLPLRYAREYARRLSLGNAFSDSTLQFGGLGRSLGGVTLEKGNYADVLFPPVETRLAPAARCRLSFRLESAGLRPGSYALLVTVTDLNARRVAFVRSSFAILAAEGFRAAMSSE